MVGGHVTAGEFTRVMTWLPNSQELAFAAGSVIVLMQSKCQENHDTMVSLPCVSPENESQTACLNDS